MICSNCGTENEAGRKFCKECATRLTVPCPSCGAANSADAKFCGECATALVAGAAAAPSATPPVAERRLVSVLFADLVGFTTLAEGRTPRTTRELLTRYFELARDVIERYGGTVEKFIGDAVMAVWGAPTAHEDDAERAVRAALELVDAVKALGPTIQARAGVLTGEAAVTIGATNQGMVAGDLVNTASRLQSVAPPGTVLVGEATQRAAARAIAFEAAGEQTLKGKAAPVPAWRALRVVAEVGGRNRAETLEAPFVGRDDELRLLKDLFHATTREGRARLVSVIGPAGIGKTRLAWEFLKYLDGLVETRLVPRRALAGLRRGISFWALGEMVRRRAGLLETDDEPTTRAKIARDARRARPRPGRAALDRAGPARPARRRVRGGSRAALRRLADVLRAPGRDGARWSWSSRTSTTPTRGCSTSSTTCSSGAGTSRSTSSPSRGPSCSTAADWGAGKRNFTSLYLEPLAESAMRELLGGLVPGLPAAGRQGDRRPADGIPLYAVETVRMLLAEGDSPSRTASTAPRATSPAWPCRRR